MFKYVQGDHCLLVHKLCVLRNCLDKREIMCHNTFKSAILFFTKDKMQQVFHNSCWFSLCSDTSVCIQKNILQVFKISLRPGVFVKCCIRIKFATFTAFAESSNLEKDQDYFFSGAV